LNLGTPHARREITQEQRDSVVAKVSGSLRTIELEATRHNMLEAAAFNAFEGADRTKVMQMLSERQAIKLAIGAAVQRNDFDELLGELTRALELNSSVTELLTNKFLELLRKDRERVTVQIRECIPAEAPLS
jgi:hypothetical protein